jgi:hypothetical protein
VIVISFKYKFGPKRGEAAEGWRRLHNEELHNLYASPNVIKVIKSGKMGWEGM